MYYERAYWNNEYKQGNGSGPGSTGHMLQHKIDFLNKFIEEHKVSAIIDFGCGDGELMSKLKITDPNYLGIDISIESIKLCKGKRPLSDIIQSAFPDADINFRLNAHTVICIDVLFHILDIEELKLTLCKIWESADKYIIFYTFNQPRERDREWVKSRCVTQLIEEMNLHYSSMHKYPGHESTKALWLIYKIGTE